MDQRKNYIDSVVYGKVKREEGRVGVGIAFKMMYSVFLPATLVLFSK